MSTQSDYIDRLNYYNDPRTRGKAKLPVLYRYDDETGECIEEPLPVRWEICATCEGEGKHVNPSIDAGGLREEEYYDDDFMDGYMSGVYDVVCSYCGGAGKVQEVDWSALTDEQETLYAQQLEDDRAYEAERRAELIMGC